MSILKNYSYNLIYQITSIIIPIVTIPYISRVIGVNGIGLYSYINSITQYFILFANMGLSLYASREIAYANQDKEKRSKVFTEIVTIQFVCSSLILIFYLTYIYLFCGVNRNLYFIQSILIIAIAFDISWFYIGTENFKKNVIRNLIVRIVAFILLFLVVKTPDDLWKYMLLLAGSTLLGQIYMWIGITNYINRIKLKELNILNHIYGVRFIFFIYLMGIVGSNLNKTLIGNLISIKEVGKYDMSYKITMIILVITTSLGSVMTPRISATYAEGNNKKISEYLNAALQFTLLFCFLVIPLIIGISKNFVHWFFGIGFFGVEDYMILLSPMILLNSLSNFITTQYMIPIGKEQKYLNSLLIGGTVGIISSLILVGRYSTIGACISVLIGELTILLVHLLQVRKQLFPLIKLDNLWQYFFASITVFIITYFLSQLIFIPILLTFFQVTISLFFYILMILIFKNEFALKIIEKAKQQMFKK